MPFTGCLETEDSDDIPSLRNSVDKLYEFWETGNNDYEGFCGMVVEPDGKFLNWSDKE